EHLAVGKSGLVVIDVDDLSVLDDLRSEFPGIDETLTAESGRAGGGLHLYLTLPAGVTIKSRRWRPGVDVKSSGGHVMAPPSIHPQSGIAYRWRDESLAPLEAFPGLIAALQRPQRAHTADAIRTSSTAMVVSKFTDVATRYGEAALRGEIERMRDAPLGDRNNTLNGCAFNLGTLVSGGELPEQQVRDTLRAVAESAFGGDSGPGEIDGTLNSGLLAGMDNPRSAPTVVLPIGDVVAPLVAEAAAHLPDGIGVGEAATTQVLVDTFGDRLRWVQEQRTWWICSRTTRPGFWSPEDREGSELMAHATAVAHARRVSAPGNAVAIMLGPRYAEAVLRLARPRLAARPRDFNADPWMLGVRNGVVDLRTGALSVASPEMLLTKQAGAAY